MSPNKKLEKKHTHPRRVGKMMFLKIGGLGGKAYRKCGAFQNEATRNPDLVSNSHYTHMASPHPVTDLFQGIA